LKVGVALSGGPHPGLNNLFKGQVFALRFDVRSNRGAFELLAPQLCLQKENPATKNFKVFAFRFER
jgi:hypothetical protein